MYVRNLEGTEYPLQTTITNEGELNGNQSISLKITSNKVNDLFIDDFGEMWIVSDHEDVEHKVVYAQKKGEGNRLYIDVKGIPLFFDEFDVDRIYEEYNEHMTADRCFSLIFKNTNFNYVLLGSFAAVQWEGFGKGEAKLELFKQAIERYKCEFRISGNTIYLEAQIGRDTNIMYRHKLNASNIVQEIDASALWTYAKGFGDFEEGEESKAKLIREYTSPLAAIIGKRHAPPIYDGRVKVASTMDGMLKTLVDESLKISVSADLHDLTKQNYPIDQTQLGDRVFLIDERIQLNEEVRIVNKSITRDWRGNIIDLNVTFGSESIGKRHQSNLQTAINNITDLLQGKKKLPFSSLDAAVMQATKALQAAQTELYFTDNGILAIDKTNPNFVVLLNSAGIGVSLDGGTTFRTAMTGEGIVADLITVGTMLFDRIKGGTLTLGGTDNGDGKMVVLNKEGDIIADLDADRGGFDELVIGNLISDSVVKVNTESYDLYVNPNSGSDDNDGLSWSTAFETVQCAINSIPKYNHGTITINVFVDNGNGVLMREIILLYGFVGNGEIILDFRGRASILDGWISITGCTNTITVKAITVRQRAGASADSAVRAWNSARVFFERINVVGNGLSNHGFYIQCSNADIRECDVQGLGGEENCITGALHANVNVVDCTGKGKVGFRGYSGAKFSGYGTQPQGTVAAQSLTSGAFTFSTWSGGGTPPPAPPPPPPSETTQSWTRTSSKSWRPNYGGQWYDGSDVLQGKWSSWGVYKGLWFFGSSVRNTVNGKTIKRIRVKLSRANNSGYSSSVNAIIRPHGYSSQPTGEPSFLGSVTHSVGFKWGESKWVTLPSSFHSYFANGQAYGIGIYTTSTSNTNYMRFKGSCEIEITYA